MASFSGFPVADHAGWKENTSGKHGGDVTGLGMAGEKLSGQVEGYVDREGLIWHELISQVRWMYRHANEKYELKLGHYSTIRVDLGRQRRLLSVV